MPFEETVASVPGPSGEQSKKLRRQLRDVDTNLYHATDFEESEPPTGGVPTAKRSKPATSTATMDCDTDDSEDEDLDGDDQDNDYQADCEQDDVDEDDDEEEEEVDENDDDDDDDAELEILDVEEEDDDHEVHSAEANIVRGRRPPSRSRRLVEYSEHLRLEDYLPECYIDSHEKRDKCSLAITMAHNARSVDITELSGDIIKLVFKGKKAFVRYMDPETATANMKIIEKAVGKGKVLRVEKCKTRKQATVSNMLDLFRLPFNCTVARLKQQFPYSRVCVLKHGFARLSFKSSDDLKRAIQRPGCHTIDGHPIRLSLVKELRKEDDYYGGGRQYRESRGDDYYSGRGTRGWKRSSGPAERPFWRGDGGRGGGAISRMGSRNSDWESGGRGDWCEFGDWDSRAWRGGNRFFWNSGGGGRRGRRGGRRGSWARF